jgi:hypothetical protein
VWNSTFFCFSMSSVVLSYSDLFVIIFIVLLLIIFKVWFNLLTTCSIVAVSLCMFVILGTNIGGGARSFLSCLVSPSVPAYRRASKLLVIVI